MTATSPFFDLRDCRIWVAGHKGMLGSALVRRIAHESCKVLTVDRVRLDLRRQADVERWMRAERPDVILLAAAHVGGILANSHKPADFISDNLAVQAHVIDTAAEIGTRKLLFLGSSCIYPRLAPQPISEDALMTGPLEPTNQWYAIAKIAGLMQCQAYRLQHGCDFISAMPTNLYGPGDNFDAETSHVLPAFVRRFHEAASEGRSEVVVWGTGTPRREFMHVDDCADALIFILKSYSDAQAINVGVGDDITIAELARLVADVVGFQGEIVFDPSQPDGTPQKLLNVDRLKALNWNPRIGLRDGVERTYAWFRDQLARGSDLRGFSRASIPAGDAG